MRRLVHLSDLHFGRERPELLEPLLDAVRATRPDVIAISGDLTQRAREGQFRDAHAFVRRLAAPCVVVPGNHDLPLDQPLTRLVNPWGAYRNFFASELEPEYRDAEITVLGVNTVNPLSWQRGWIAGRALRRIQRALEGEPRDRCRVLVAHHPFEQGPFARKRLMHGAHDAVDVLAACGVDVVLSGHLHVWAAEPFARRDGRAGLIQVHAGTGLSSRLRGEENDFNLLTLTPGAITVERFAARGGVFVPAAVARFRLGEAGWEVRGSEG